MRLNIKTASALSTIIFATILSGAKVSEKCNFVPPVSCHFDRQQIHLCLGPENTLANSPYRPHDLAGSWTAELGGIYWRAQEEGLTYAASNEAASSDGITSNRNMNTLTDAKFLSPNFSWGGGFKLGARYHTTRDGWDLGAKWTHFSKGTSGSVSARFSDNQALLPILSAFQSPSAGTAPLLFAEKIETFWKLNLNLVDAQLGKAFWAGRYLTARPHVGLRYADIKRSYTLRHRGGTWENLGQADKRFSDLVNLASDFKGIGLRSGVDTLWSLGWGWGLYSELAASIIYGRFATDHRENIRLVQPPFTDIRIHETHARFRAPRAMLDLGLGVSWTSLLCQCRYAARVSLGWEHLLVFHHNQIWRVRRLGGNDQAGLLNSSGKNHMAQSRGTLTTSGWTLKGSFDF